MPEGEYSDLLPRGADAVEGVIDRGLEAVILADGEPQVGDGLGPFEFAEGLDHGR